MVLFNILLPLLVLLSCGGGGDDPARELFLLAGEAYRRGDPGASAGYLTEVLRLDPGNVNAWFNMGTASMDLGLYPEAVEAYRRVIELDSTRVDALTGLTGALTGAGRYEEALHTGELAVHLNPTDGMAFNNYGMALMETGRFSEAASSFNTALRRAPDNPSILYNCGRIALMSGNAPGALSFFDRAVSLAPEHLGARLERARTLGILGLDSKAEEAALAILASDPGNTDAMGILALACSAVGRQEEAIELLTELLTENPEDLRSLLGIAECHYRRGDTYQALEHYRSFMTRLEDTTGTGAVRTRISELEELHGNLSR